MYAYIPDILVILISSMACLYCLILSRRLKRLQSLEHGLGASILSLTTAIEKTNDAATNARQSTHDSIAVLQRLLHDAQDTMPQIEARLVNLSRARISAQTAHRELEKILVSEVKPELLNARQTSKSLIQIVREVTDLHQRIRKGRISQQAARFTKKVNPA